MVRYWQVVVDPGLWVAAEAFRRCSYLPARVLDQVAPAAQAKGHLRVGADADIVVVDPASVSDTATYAEPTRAARGVRNLLVNGTFVVRDGELDPGTRPGRAIRGALR